MHTDSFTGRPTRLRGSELVDRDGYAALQDDHQRRLEALARLSAAAARVGFGTDPDDDLVLSDEDGLILLAAADPLWGELNRSLREFRARLPILPLDTFGFPADSDDPFGEGSPWLRRIGSGVEASAYEAEDRSIYKFFLPREEGRIGGSFTFRDGGEETALFADASLGTYRALLEKLQLILALSGMPTEVVGVTPEGVLVAKQTLGERLPEDADTSGLLPAGLIPFPARFLRARRDHPRLFFFRDQPWLIADLHAKNLVRAVDGQLRAIDLLAAPLPVRKVTAEPLFADWLGRVALDPEATALPGALDAEL